MTTALNKSAYSYKNDAAVPDFDDSGPITVMDGNCALCSTGARLIARFDAAQEFRICRSQSPLGHALLTHYDMSPDDPETWLYLVDGQAHSSLNAMILAGARLGGVGLMLQPLRLMPRTVQDWLYRRIARNRYRMFGRSDICAIPDPALQKRLMK